MANTFNATLPASAPYAAVNICIVSKHNGLDPSSAHMPITALGSSAAMRSRSHCGSSMPSQSRRNSYTLSFSPIPEATRSHDTRPVGEPRLPLELRMQVAEQPSLAIIARRIVAVPALRRNRQMLPGPRVPDSAAPRPAPCQPKPARDAPPPPRHPGCRVKILSGVISGTPYPLASRSLIRKICPIPSVFCSSRASSTQGRLVSFR